MAKSKEKLLARQLRRQGESIKKISQRLNVSAGSVVNWCADIELTKEQIENLKKRSTDPYYGKKADYLKRKKEEMRQLINKLKQIGIKEVGRLTKRDIFIIGIALYWGEGFKKDHQVGFATSDTNMAYFFIYWLEKCFNIGRNQLILRVTANISYKNKIDELEKYWSDKLIIPVNNFSKPFFQNSIWKKEYENKDDYHGVIRIRVRKSMNFLRKIFGYIEGIIKNIEQSKIK